MSKKAKSNIGGKHKGGTVNGGAPLPKSNHDKSKVSKDNKIGNIPHSNKK